MLSILVEYWKNNKDTKDIGSIIHSSYVQQNGRNE